MQNILINRYIGDKKFLSKVFVILLPMLMQMTITNIVNLLDNLMVGQLGTLEISAVSIVNHLIFIFCIAIFGGLSGIGIYSTQFAGARNFDGMRHCFRIKWLIGLLITLIFTAIFLCFDQGLISAFIEIGTSPDDALVTTNLGVDYLFIMIGGLLPFAIAQIYGTSLKEFGDTKMPMIAGLLAIAVNAILNWLLIFGNCGMPRMEVKGAAIATVISRFVEMGFIIAVAHIKVHKYEFIHRVYSSFHIPLQLIKQTIHHGTPLFINEFLWASGIAMVVQSYSVRGIHVFAANAIVATVFDIFNTLFIATGCAAGIIVGQLLGAQLIDEAKIATRRLLTLGTLSAAFTGTMMYFAAPYIPLLYNTHEMVQTLATELIQILAILLPMYGFTHACYFILRSGGRTGITFAFDSLYTWSLTVPGAWLLTHYTDLPIEQVYFIVQFGEIGKLIVGFIFIKRGMWIRNLISNL